MFTVKSTHAKQQIDYGLRNGYDTLILAISKEDNTKGEYVSSMDLERALEFLKTKVKTNLQSLELAGMVSRRDQYQDLLNSIVQVVLTR